METKPKKIIVDNFHLKKTAVDEARSTVNSAVRQNPVLFNLFGAGQKKIQTEKEKADALFTRNC